jgi:dUTP pyrophosphatase
LLSGDEIQRRQLVELLDGAASVQPNGVDLSLDAVWRFSANGTLGRADRLLAPREELSFDTEGWIALPLGTYGIRYREAVNLPADSGGLCFPRSSLLRMGVYVPTAVWDAGYRGRGEGLLVVENPHGVRLQHAARIAQLVLFRLTESAQATYAGRYQDENRAQDPERSGY